MIRVDAWRGGREQWEDGETSQDGVKEEARLLGTPRSAPVGLAFCVLIRKRDTQDFDPSCQQYKSSNPYYDPARDISRVVTNWTLSISEYDERGVVGIAISLWDFSAAR